MMLDIMAPDVPDLVQHVLVRMARKGRADDRNVLVALVAGRLPDGRWIPDPADQAVGLLYPQGGRQRTQAVARMHTRGLELQIFRGDRREVQLSERGLAASFIVSHVQQAVDHLSADARRHLLVLGRATRGSSRDDEIVINNRELVQPGFASFVGDAFAMLLLPTGRIAITLIEAMEIRKGTLS